MSSRMLIEDSTPTVVGDELVVPVVDPGKPASNEPSGTGPAVAAGNHLRSQALLLLSDLPCACSSRLPAALLPPPTDVLAPPPSTDVLEDVFISWVPTNTTNGLCEMQNAADLPEAFLLVSWLRFSCVWAHGLLPCHPR